MPDGLIDKPIEISKQFSIGPRHEDDLPNMPQHYINHSCDPNAGFEGQVFLVAMRNIRGGEEITYDYAMVMQPNAGSGTYFSFTCRCGTVNCRGVVKENDWERPELQERYRGFFQFYTQREIDNRKNNQ